MRGRNNFFNCVFLSEFKEKYLAFSDHSNSSYFANNSHFGKYQQFRKYGYHVLCPIIDGTRNILSCFSLTDSYLKACTIFFHAKLKVIHDKNI